MEVLGVFLPSIEACWAGGKGFAKKICRCQPPRRKTIWGEGLLIIHFLIDSFCFKSIFLIFHFGHRFLNNGIFRKCAVTIFDTVHIEVSEFYMQLPNISVEFKYTYLYTVGRERGLTKISCDLSL